MSNAQRLALVFGLAALVAALSLAVARLPGSFVGNDWQYHDCGSALEAKPAFFENDCPEQRADRLWWVFGLGIPGLVAVAVSVVSLERQSKYEPTATSRRRPSP
jgi:hypothetical protein